MGYDWNNGDWERVREDSTTRPIRCKRCDADACLDEDYCAKCLNDLALSIIDEEEGRAADAAYIASLPRITTRAIDPIAFDKACQNLANAIVALERKRLVS